MSKTSEVGETTLLSSEELTSGNEGNSEKSPEKESDIWVPMYAYAVSNKIASEDGQLDESCVDEDLFPSPSHGETMSEIGDVWIPKFKHMTLSENSSDFEFEIKGIKLKTESFEGVDDPF
uniref:Uncharacterized protein LOC111116550 n=1 Tax=Crassostrea virginica TaxID=6565 RepID=A0A8B8C915_CRAVI|nr:uncharacterized protein LOC111116550 [Crassostrea virginica]